MIQKHFQNKSAFYEAAKILAKRGVILTLSAGLVIISGCKKDSLNDPELKKLMVTDTFLHKTIEDAQLMLKNGRTDTIKLPIDTGSRGITSTHLPKEPIGH